MLSRTGLEAADPQDLQHSNSELIEQPLKSKYELYEEKAETLVEALTNQAYQKHLKNQRLPKMQKKANKNAYKAYIEENPEYLSMHQSMCSMGQKPSVAALALFETQFAGIEQAFTWIYEADDGPQNKLAHPFIGCLPAAEEFQQPHLPFLAADEDIERGGRDLDASKMICYICGQSRQAHRDDDHDLDEEFQRH